MTPERHRLIADALGRIPGTHYGLFTNQPAHTERGLVGIKERL